MFIKIHITKCYRSLQWIMKHTYSQYVCCHKPISKWMWKECISWHLRQSRQKFFFFSMNRTTTTTTPNMQFYGSHGFYAHHEIWLENFQVSFIHMDWFFFSQLYVHYSTTKHNTHTRNIVESIFYLDMIVSRVE